MTHYSSTNVIISEEISYDDLPDVDILKQDLKISNYTMKSIMSL